MKNYVVVAACLLVMNANMSAMDQWPMVNKDEITVYVDDVNDQGDPLLELGEVTLMRNSSPRVCVKKDRWNELLHHLAEIATKTGSKKACCQLGYIHECLGEKDFAKKWYKMGNYVEDNPCLSSAEKRYLHRLFHDSEPDSKEWRLDLSLIRLFKSESEDGTAGNEFAKKWHYAPKDFFEYAEDNFLHGIFDEAKDDQDNPAQWSSSTSNETDSQGWRLDMSVYREPEVFEDDSEMNEQNFYYLGIGDGRFFTIQSSTPLTNLSDE